MENSKYLYKNIKFNAYVFKTYKGLYIAAKDKNFYGQLALILKTIPNNPKRCNKYKLVGMGKKIKDDFFKDILLVYTGIKLEYNEHQSEKIDVLEKETEIHIKYNKDFIYEYESKIKKLNWDSVYGEVMIEEMIFCPNWLTKS